MQEQRADQHESQETFHADKLHSANLVSDLDLFPKVTGWAWAKMDGCGPLRAKESHDSHSSQQFGRLASCS